MVAVEGRAAEGSPGGLLSRGLPPIAAASAGWLSRWAASVCTNHLGSIAQVLAPVPIPRPLVVGPPPPRPPPVPSVPFPSIAAPQIHAVSMGREASDLFAVVRTLPPVRPAVPWDLPNTSAGQEREKGSVDLPSETTQWSSPSLVLQDRQKPSCCACSGGPEAFVSPVPAEPTNQLCRGRYWGETAVGVGTRRRACRHVHGGCSGACMTERR